MQLARLHRRCAGHADIDRALLVGEELLGTGHQRRRPAEGLDGPALHLAVGADLLVLEVRRLHDRRAVVQVDVPAEGLPPEDAVVGFLEHRAVERLAQRGTRLQRRAGVGFRGEDERNGDDVDRRHRAGIAGERGRAGLDGAGADGARHFVVLEKLGGREELDLQLAAGFLLDDLREVFPVPAERMSFGELQRHADGGFGLNGE